MSERVSPAYERGEAISVVIAQAHYNLAMFTRHSEQYGCNSAAAHSLMSSELARQALRPTFRLRHWHCKGCREPKASKPLGRSQNHHSL